MQALDRIMYGFLIGAGLNRGSAALVQPAEAAQARHTCQISSPFRESCLAALVAFSAATPAAELTPEQQEARLAKRIAGDLEAGHVTEARGAAEAGVKQFPASALLRRRLAQAHVAVALQKDGQLQDALDDARLGQNLSHAVSWVQNGDVLPADPTAEQREQFSRFLLFLAGPEVTQFQERAMKGLQASTALLQERGEALTGAFADVKEARRLGDAGTELELTDLWAQTVVLLWRQQPEKLKRMEKGRLAGIEAALAPFTAIQPDGVLRAAAALAKQRATDPVALAGAADVISVTAGISKKPDALGPHLVRVLDHTYYQNAAATDAQLTKAARETHQQLYEQLRDAKEPDVLAAPAAVALQLYSQALEHDPGYTLPYLRLRLYLLRLAFDRDAARPLLEEIRRHEPGNMVVPLEEARATMLLDDQPVAALGYVEAATRLPGFSRSYLVAVPEPLRRALKFQRELREWVRQGWPGYGWLWTTMMQMREPEGAPWLPRAQLELYRPLAQQVDFRGLELRVAERFCQAPDYGDEVTGIGGKGGMLSDMLHLAEKQHWPPEQQDALRRQLEAHRLAYADFPRTRFALRLTLSGLQVDRSPSFEEPDNHIKGPELRVTGLGPSLFNLW